MSLRLTTEVMHTVYIEEGRPRMALSTGHAEIDRVVAHQFNGAEWTIQASGFVIKKDNSVGNARRQSVVALDELPGLVQTTLHDAGVR